MSNVTSFGTMEKLREWFDYLYYDLWEEYAHKDLEINSYPLIHGGPWATGVIVLIYVLIVLVAGPIYMRGRKAFNLKKTIITFDIFLVLFNAAIVVIGLYVANLGFDTWFGCNVTWPNASKRNLAYALGYAYFITKFLDLADTLFFVMRKKSRNLSFLHIFHHSVMPFVAWAGLKYVPYPLAGWALGANCFVHVIMYTYYALAALGYHPTWKQWITILQMGHFITISLHGIHILLFVVGEGCVYPEPIAHAEVLVGAIFFILFAHFHINNYILPVVRKRDFIRLQNQV